MVQCSHPHMKTGKTIALRSPLVPLNLTDITLHLGSGLISPAAGLGALLTRGRGFCSPTMLFQEHRFSFRRPCLLQQSCLAVGVGGVLAPPLSLPEFSSGLNGTGDTSKLFWQIIQQWLDWERKRTRGTENGSKGVRGRGEEGRKKGRGGKEEMNVKNGAVCQVCSQIKSSHYVENASVGSGQLSSFCWSP